MKPITLTTAVVLAVVALLIAVIALIGIWPSMPVGVGIGAVVALAFAAGLWWEARPTTGPATRAPADQTLGQDGLSALLRINPNLQVPARWLADAFPPHVDLETSSGDPRLTAFAAEHDCTVSIRSRPPATIEFTRRPASTATSN